MHEYTSLVLIFLFLISCICGGWFLAQKLAKTDRTSLSKWSLSWFFREHKKLDAETFPDYRPSAEQIANMYFLAELLQAAYSSHLIEVAELFREAGDFNASIGALKLHTGPKDNFYKSVLYLSIKNQT